MSQDDKDVKNAEDTEAEVAETEAESEAEAEAESDASDEAEAEANEEAESDSDADSDADSDEADSDEAETDSAEASDDGGKDEAARPGPGENEELYGVLAEFRSPGELIDAAEKVRDAGFTKWDCYSPFPVHGIDPAMGIKRTILPWIVFCFGLCGLGGGLLLQWWTNDYNWPWIVAGKPFFSIPANIPITFETTILASVLSCFFGMWGLNKLPQAWHPFFKKDQFLRTTDDSFFIGIEAADDKFVRGETTELLQKAGALDIDEVYTRTDPDRLKLPKPVVAFILVSTVLALVPFALVTKARADRAKDPHFHIIPNMDFQPKAKAQTASDLFWDRRASRAEVPGTVAQGELKDDDHFYRGIVGGQWATELPAQVAEKLDRSALERGANRYAIYCQPCHGANAKGLGMIHQRAMTVAQQGWVQPTNLLQPNIVQQPHGQIFNTISNGIRTMKGYSAQIPEDDRWAIVLYLRALQRAQNASVEDVPQENRKDIR